MSLSYVRYLQPRFYLLTSFSIDNIYIELFSVMTYPIEQVVSISLDLTLIKMILITVDTCILVIFLVSPKVADLGMDW